MPDVNLYATKGLTDRSSLFIYVGNTALCAVSFAIILEKTLKKCVFMVKYSKSSFVFRKRGTYDEKSFFLYSRYHNAGITVRMRQR